MIIPSFNIIDPDVVLRLQKDQWQTAAPLEKWIPAASNVDAVLDITTLGHLMQLFINGDFTTKVDDGEGGVTDDGICQIRLQLFDGTGNKPLWLAPVIANMVLSPGRVQIIPGVGNPSEPLRTFYPFIYQYENNGRLIMRMYNDADFENRVRLNFTSIRITGKNTEKV